MHVRSSYTKQNKKTKNNCQELEAHLSCDLITWEADSRGPQIQNQPPT